MSNRLKDIYSRLFRQYGPQGWWPGETAFEVAVGAILTQNTNWSNVEKAIGNLKAAGVLTPSDLHGLPRSELASYIRPAGYYNIKAKRLKNFLDLLVGHYGSSMKKMAAEPLSDIRKILLGVNGIGPETADSIVLYALQKPVFVIDAYTKRILSRHDIMPHEASYHEFQEMFHKGINEDVVTFNEYHALLVRLAKEHCRPKPLCAGCPLEGV